MRSIAKAVHLLSLGLWLGGATFFSFFVALPVIRGMEDLAAREGNWLHLTEKRQGTRLAGEVLTIVFDRYFPYQVVCGAVAVVTALALPRPSGGLAKVRLAALGAALGLAVANLVWLAPRVAQLRQERYSAAADVAAAAEAAFGPAHTVSLLADMLTLVLTAVALILMAWQPGAQGQPQTTVRP
jgi:hypothetical protein